MAASILASYVSDLGGQRPAFGFWPWFALLRRDFSLRFLVFFDMTAAPSVLWDRVRIVEAARRFARRGTA
jgi:hypothetical protein